MYKDNLKKLKYLLHTNFNQYFDEKNHLMKAGVNGPYSVKETPLRNTAHWLVILSILAEESDYRGEALKRIKLLQNGIKKFHKPENFNFHSLETSQISEQVNGTIGAAWIFEGLSYSMQHIFDKELYDICLQIYKAHKFNKKLSVWHRCLLDGSKGRIDQTFNHQLWFAYGSLAMLHKEKFVREDIRCFLNQLNKNFLTYKDGIIYHPMPYKADLKSKLNHAFHSSKSIFEIIFESSLSKKTLIDYESSMYFKSCGYHSFNIFAFSGIKKLIDHDFFLSEKFLQTLDALNTKPFLDTLKAEDCFGFKYNLPGFECLSILKNNENYFSETDKSAFLSVIDHQFSLIDLDNSTFGKINCFDKETYVASLYKALV